PPPPGYGQQPPTYGYPGYGQQPYPQQPPPYGYPAYGNPAQVDPYAKSKLVAGLLGILVGGFGVHRFYLGYVGIGIIQIVVTLVTCGLGALWGLVEGILYLVGSNGFTADASGRPLRD